MSELKNANKEEVEKVLKKIKFEATWEGMTLDEIDIGCVVREGIFNELVKLADEGIIEFTDEELPEPDSTIIVKTSTDEVIRSTWAIDVIKIDDKLYDIWVEDYLEYHWGKYKYHVDAVSLTPHDEER